MNTIEIINPFSNKYHALEDFNKLTVTQKIVTVAITILASIASLFIATAAVFRLMINHYVKPMHPQRIQLPIPKPKPLPPYFHPADTSTKIDKIETPSEDKKIPKPINLLPQQGIKLSPVYLPPKIPKAPVIEDKEIRKLPAVKNKEIPKNNDILTTPMKISLVDLPLKSQKPPAVEDKEIRKLPAVKNRESPKNNDTLSMQEKPSLVDFSPKSHKAPAGEDKEIPLQSASVIHNDQDLLLLPAFHEEELSLLDRSARKSHRIALSGMKREFNREDILSVDLFNVDEELVIFKQQDRKKVNVYGTCLKAKVADGNYIYVFDAHIFHEGKNHPLRLSFESQKDVNDVIGMGNLVLQHMEKRGYLALKNQEQGSLVIEENKEPTIFRNSLDIPFEFAEQIKQTHIPRYFSLQRRESKEDLQELLKGIKDEMELMEDLFMKERSREIPEDKEKSKENLANSTRLEEYIQKKLKPDSKNSQSPGLEEDDFIVLESSLREEDFEMIGDLNSSIVRKEKEAKEFGLNLRDCNVLSYLYHFINNPVEIKDTDWIGLDKKTIIPITDKIEAENSFRKFLLVLSATYGTDLIKRVFHRYEIDAKKTFTLKDLKMVMVGIGANVRESDLRSLFAEMKENQPEKLRSHQVGNTLYSLNNALYMDILKKGSFDELNTKELNFLYSGFRGIPIHNKTLNVLELEVESNSYLYTHDLGALKLKETWRALDLKHPVLALGEFTGKSLAYLELKHGEILPLPEVTQSISLEGDPKLYKVYDSLPDKNDAVVSHILTPLNPKEKSLYPGDQSTYAFLVFRGTLPGADDKAGGASLYRDFDSKGIGRTTYDAREEEIQKMVEDYLATIEGEVTLHISGHSLGACDAQRALVSLLKKIAKAPEGSPWKKVKRIVDTTFNAPRVNPTVNKRLKEAVREIKNKGMKVEVDLHHVRFFDLEWEDTIQKFGDILLGADLQGGTGEEVLQSYEPFKRYIYKITMNEATGLPGGFLVRHSYRPFNRALCGVPYKMMVLSSDNEQDRRQMEMEMAGNYHWNESEMGLIEQIYKTTFWYTTSVAREARKNLIHPSLNAIHWAGLKLNRWWYQASNKKIDSLRNP